MKIVLKKTGAIRTGLYVVVIREPNDPLASFPWTLCIKDSSGNVVYNNSFVYAPGIDPDVREYTFNVSALGDGVYKVDIYNWNNCSPPSHIQRYSYFIHKVDGSTLTLSGSWDYDVNRWFIIYAYDGKLFFIYDADVSGVPIPLGIPVYAEITDRNGNAFVGSIVASSASTNIEPNMKVPFMATFSIKLDRPEAARIVDYINDGVGFMRGATAQLVDDYTVNIVIAKTEPGLPPLTVFGIGLSLFGGGLIAWAVGSTVTRISEINLQAEALRSAKPAIDIAADAYQRYTKEVENCSDMACIERAQRKWLPFVQGANALVGSIVAAGIPVQPSRCDGLKLSGICVPWWVVAIAIFLAGLLVISAVK